MDYSLGASGRSVDDMFASARAIGLDGLELSVQSRDDGHPLWSDAGRAHVRSLCRDSGLQLSALATQVMMRGGFVGDPDTRAQARAHVRDLIAVATDVGVGLILVPFFRGGTIRDDTGARQVVEDLRAVVDIAAQANVVLAVETGLPAERWARLVDDVGSTWCRAYFDLGNAVTNGYDLADDARTLGSRIAGVHVKDSGETKPVQLGEGRVPLDTSAAVLREIGYDGWYTLETPPGDDPDQNARVNLATMRRHFQIA